MPKKRKRSTCTLILEIWHDFINVTTILLSFNQGDVNRSFILIKSKNLTLKFTGDLENVHDTNHG